MMKAKRGRRRKNASIENPESKVKGRRTTSERMKEFFNTLRLSPVPAKKSLPKKRNTVGRPPKNKNLLPGKQITEKKQIKKSRKKYIQFDKSTNDITELEKMHLEICTAIENKEKYLVKNVETNSDQVLGKNPVEFDPRPVEIVSARVGFQTKDEFTESSNPKNSESEPVLKKTKIFIEPKINWKVIVQLEKLTESNVFYKDFLERNLEKKENLDLSEEEGIPKKKNFHRMQSSKSFEKPDTKECSSCLEYSRKLRLDKFAASPSRRKLPDPELLIINSKNQIFKNAKLEPGIDPNYNLENVSNVSTPVSASESYNKNIETSPHVRCSIKLSNHQEISKKVIPNLEETKNVTSETKTVESKPRAIRLRRENSSICSTKSSENAFLDENSNTSNVSKTVKKRIVFDLDDTQKSNTNTRIRTISKSSTASSLNEEKQISPFVTPEKNEKNHKNQIELHQENSDPFTSTPKNVIETEIYDISQEKISGNIIDFDQDENSQEASRISSSGSQKSGSENSETSRKVKHIFRFDGMPLKVPPSKRKNLSLAERLGDKFDARLIIEKNRNLNAGKNDLGQKEVPITDFKMPFVPKEKIPTKLSMMPNLQTPNNQKTFSPLNPTLTSKDDDCISIYADSTIFESPASHINSQQQHFSNLRIQNWIAMSQNNDTNFDSENDEDENENDDYFENKLDPIQSENIFNQSKNYVAQFGPNNIQTLNDLKIPPDPFRTNLPRNNIENISGRTNLLGQKGQTKNPNEPFQNEKSTIDFLNHNVDQIGVLEGLNEFNRNEIGAKEPFLSNLIANESVIRPGESSGPNGDEMRPNQSDISHMESNFGSLGPNGGEMRPKQSDISHMESNFGSLGPNGGEMRPNQSDISHMESNFGSLAPNGSEMMPKESFLGSLGSRNQNQQLYGQDLNNIYKKLCMAFRNNGVCNKYSCNWQHKLPLNFDKQIFEYGVEEFLKFYDQVKNKSSEIYLWKILFPLVLKRLGKDQLSFERLSSLIADVMEKNFDDDKTQFISLIINAFDEFGVSINSSIDLIFKITKLKSPDLKDTLGDILLQILTERIKDLKGSWDTIETLTKNRSNIDNGSIESILKLALNEPIKKFNILNLYEEILVSLENRQLNLISENLFSKYVDCLKKFNYKNEASTLFYRRKGDDKKRWSENNQLPSEISPGAFESSDERFSSRSSDSCSTNFSNKGAKDTYKQSWNTGFKEVPPPCTNLGSGTSFGSNLGPKLSNLNSNVPNLMDLKIRPNNGPNFENRTNLQNRMNSENRINLGLNSNSATNIPNLGPRASNLRANSPNTGPNVVNSENYNIGPEKRTNLQNRINPENFTNLGTEFNSISGPRSLNIRTNLSNLRPNGTNSENRTNLQNRINPENCSNLGSEISSRSNLPNMGPISPNLRTELPNLGPNGTNFEKRNMGFENRANLQNRMNPENRTNLEIRLNSGSNLSNLGPRSLNLRTNIPNLEPTGQNSENRNMNFENRTNLQNRITPEICTNRGNHLENLEDRREFRKSLGPQNSNSNFEKNLNPENRTYHSHFSVNVENYNNYNYRTPPSMPLMGPPNFQNRVLNLDQPPNMMPMPNFHEFKPGLLGPRPAFYPRGMLNQRGLGRGYNQNRRRYENRNFDNYSNNWNKNFNGENFQQNSELRQELYKIKPPETVVSNNSEENSDISENDNSFLTAVSNQNNPSPSLTDSQLISEENRSKPVLTDSKIVENVQKVLENNDLSSPVENSNQMCDVNEKTNNLDYTAIKKSYDSENTLEILQGILNLNDNLQMAYVKFVLNFLVVKKNTPTFYNTICDAYIVCHNTKAEGVLKCLGINLMAYFVQKNELSTAFKLFKTITSYFGKNGLELEEVFLDGKKLSISRKVLIICQILIHNKEFGTVWNNLTKWSNFLCQRSEWKFPSEESDVEYRDAVFDSFMESLCLSQNKYTLKYLTEIVKIQNCDIDITSYINDCINVALNDQNLDHTEFETLERFYPNWTQEADPLIFRAVNVILFNKRSVDWLKIFDKGRELGIYPQFYGDEPHLELERNLTPEEVYMILKNSFVKRQEKNIISPLKISIKNHFLQSTKYISIPTLPPPVPQKDMIFRIANVCRQKLNILFDIDQESNSIIFKTDHLKDFYEKML